MQDMQIMRSKLSQPITKILNFFKIKREYLDSGWDYQKNRQLILAIFANFQMNNIYSDNKIDDPESSTQQISLRSLPLSPQLPLRLSISHKKRPSTKKFFFPIRNQSSRPEDSKQKLEIDSLLKKQKIMLLSQKPMFNELLMTPEIVLRQNEILSFPSLEVKHINQIEQRSPSKRLWERPSQCGFRLDDIRRDFHSNILGNPTISSAQTQWQSENKIEGPSTTQKTRFNPIALKKSTVSQSQPRRAKQQKRFYPEVPSPSPLSRIRSQVQIDPVIDSPKKYRKGYLSYQPNGPQIWQNITSSLQQAPIITSSPKVATAKIFYCLNLDTMQPLVCQQADQQIQIASLSKIMTCYLTLLIAKKYEIQLKNIYYRVPDWIAETPGTSAQLVAGDIIAAYDLLFGLMLPSGNDAALCLAQLMGKVIQKHRKKQQKRSFLETFLFHMNLFSKQLDLPQEWGNPHGLSASPNTSTAKAIAALTVLALKDETFRLVINTRQYEVSIKNDRFGLFNKRAWKNTNKLLQKEGWKGVKTGTTDTAGHCLMSMRDNLLIGVFDCQTLSKRFTDSLRLSDYIISHKDYHYQ